MTVVHCKSLLLVCLHEIRLMDVVLNWLADVFNAADVSVVVGIILIQFETNKLS